MAERRTLSRTTELTGGLQDSQAGRGRASLTTARMHCAEFQKQRRRRDEDEKKARNTGHSLLPLQDFPPNKNNYEMITAIRFAKCQVLQNLNILNLFGLNETNR